MLFLNSEYSTPGNMILREREERGVKSVIKKTFSTAKKRPTSNINKATALVFYAQKGQSRLFEEAERREKIRGLWSTTTVVKNY